MSSIVQDIVGIYEAESDLLAPVSHAEEVPARYGQITAEWLTSILCKTTPGARVESFALDARDDGSSNRRRIFLTYNTTGVEARLPGSVFCKAAESLQNRLMLGMAGSGQSETNFYRKVRNRLQIEAPIAYHAAFDPNNFAYIVVLEDMAGRAEFCDERTVIDWERATQMVTTLARLHSRFYASPELGSPTLPFKAWPAWWDKLIGNFADYSTFCDTAFGVAESVIPPRLFRRRGEIWQATEKSVERHRELPHSLIHCDVHLKNWYLTADNMGLADWQLTSTSHWSKDYIYAIVTALTVENRRKWDHDLLTLYLEKMKEFGAPRIDFDDAFRCCRQQLFSPLSFWTVTLRPTQDMPQMQPERTTYEFLRRLTTAIDDYDSLDSF